MSRSWARRGTYESARNRSRARFLPTRDARAASAAPRHSAPSVRSARSRHIESRCTIRAHLIAGGGKYVESRKPTLRSAASGTTLHAGARSVKALRARWPPQAVARSLDYGAEVNVFQHRSSDIEAHDGMPPALAARSLLVLQGFAPGGLVKKRGEPGSATAAPLNRGAFVLVHGQSVFETLMFNLLVYAPEFDKPVAGTRAPDLPCWEQPEPPRQIGDKETSRRPNGWIDWLTWQSRRLELDYDASTNAVGGVVYCVGQGLDDEGLCDPMLAYRVDKIRGLVPIDFSEDRAAWRDCHSLVRTTGADGARAALAIAQLSCFELSSVLAHRSRVPIDVSACAAIRPRFGWLATSACLCRPSSRGLRTAQLRRGCNSARRRSRARAQ